MEMDSYATHLCQATPSLSSYPGDYSCSNSDHRLPACFPSPATTGVKNPAPNLLQRSNKPTIPLSGAALRFATISSGHKHSWCSTVSPVAPPIPRGFSSIRRTLLPLLCFPPPTSHSTGDPTSSSPVPSLLRPDGGRTFATSHFLSLSLSFACDHQEPSMLLPWLDIGVQVRQQSATTNSSENWSILITCSTSGSLPHSDIIERINRNELIE
ncbi:hypothetical protein L1887_24055 [Cichorium endivia]|nr:hypothetical protein L1887_24055 [Cichorium endivia]